MAYQWLTSGLPYKIEDNCKKHYHGYQWLTLITILVRHRLTRRLLELIKKHYQSTLTS